MREEEREGLETKEAAMVGRKDGERERARIGIRTKAKKGHFS